MTKHLYAVTTMGVITNISFEQYGRAVWVKAVFDKRGEAQERADEMNTLSHGHYAVEQITVKTVKVKEAA